MSLVVTGGVALAYTFGVVGVHRWSVWRRRRRAQGYPALDWLDWDTLLAGLVNAGAADGRSIAAKEGGPTPRCLAGASPAREVLISLVEGQPVTAGACVSAGLRDSDAAWVETLSRRHQHPHALLAELSAHPTVTVAEAYLREWLALQHEVTPLTVEWQVYASKRRLSAAMRRFGDVPALYFARAKASSLLGFSQSVLDDVGRAVFFSREARFYVEAVLAMPFVEELRPPLARVCQAAAARWVEADAASQS